MTPTFNTKVFERIREFQQQGTALLIVSHDRLAIQSLCGRALLLDRGRLVKDGDPEEVMDFYNALIAEKENATIRTSTREDGRVQTISGTGEAVVEDITLLDEEGRPVEFVNVGQPVELRVVVRANADLPRLVLGYMIKDRLGQPVYGTNTHHTRQVVENVAAGTQLDYRVRFPMNIGMGSYSVSTALVSTDTHLVNNYEWRDLALMFTVTNLDRPHFVGTAWVPPTIEVTVP
ncbi:Wzt carbohydrate-binding domain-containing protein [Rhodanobacter lindaniclasticus]